MFALVNKMKAAFIFVVDMLDDIVNASHYKRQEEYDESLMNVDGGGALDRNASDLPSAEY